MKKKKLKGLMYLAVDLFIGLTISVNPFLDQPKAESGASLVPPKFEVVPDWPKPLPGNWVTGEVAGTCVDSQDHVFIVNRLNLTAKELRVAHMAPAIIEFDPEGNVVNSKTPAVLPTRLHGCFVDYQDNVWLAGNGDAIVQKYSHDLSTLLLQTGTKGLFDTSDGTEKGTPLNSSHTRLNQPADIAVDPDNGDVYIADGYGNSRVVVFDKDGHFLRQWGSKGTVADANAGAPAKFLGPVHCVNIGRNGLVYVCDRKGDRIQVFDKMGTFIRNIWAKKGVGINTEASIGSACDMAFSTDRRQTFIYVTNMEQETMCTLTHGSGELVAEFGGHMGHMAAEFEFLHTVAVDSKGNLYTGETIDGRRLQKFKAVGLSPGD